MRGIRTSLSLLLAFVVLAEALPAQTSSCGDVPQVVRDLLPQCGSVVPMLTAPRILGDGLYHGVCFIQVYNGNQDPSNDYSFDWIGATGFTTSGAARPNNCECQKVRDTTPPCVPLGGGGDVCKVIQEGDCDTSPIVVSLNGPVKLTGVPVSFDIDGDGSPDNIAWARPSTAFLALDRNGNGAIDNGTELFGTATPESEGNNGYAALAALDVDQDGWVTAADVQALLLWFDLNSNGLTEPGELQSAWSHLRAVGTEHRDWARTDQYGNSYRWKGAAETLDGRRVSTVDVVFARVP